MKNLLLFFLFFCLVACGPSKEEQAKEEEFLDSIEAALTNIPEDVKYDIVDEETNDKTIIFYPDGKPYTGTSKTINQLNKEFEEHGRVYTFISSTDQEDDMPTIGFKLFTNEPLWVVTEDTTKIQKAIKSFNLDDFLHSWEFEFELEQYIKEGTLSDLFILETLGQPDNKSKYFDKDIQIDNWTYSDIGVTLTFKNSIVTSYIKIK